MVCYGFHVGIRFGYPDHYLEQGEQPELRAACGLDAAGIAASVKNALNR